MTWLGVVDDLPPFRLQPRIKHGVHFRWSMGAGRGFPWYGFYLFRRPHEPSQAACVMSSVSGLLDVVDGVPTLGGSGLSLELPLGRFTSDQPITFTELFPPATVAEMDLRNRSYLRFSLPEGNVAWRVEAKIGFLEGPLARKIVVRAISAHATVESVHVTGDADEVVDVTLEADSITDVEFSSGSAVLIELCYYLVYVGGGWEKVPDFEYPMCLPVLHPSYPCSGGAATDEATSRTLALGRISYGNSTDWGGEAFTDLHERLVGLVQGGPAGTPMADVEDADVAAVVASADPAMDEPVLPALRYLDWILLSALHPSVAQMLGMYWRDPTAEEEVVYDYIVLADPDGTLGLDVKIALAWLNGTPTFDVVDAWICFNVRLVDARPLDPPDDLRSFALPGPTRRAAGGVGAVSEGTNNVGLRWALRTLEDPTGGSGLRPGSSVLHYVWRARAGGAGGAAPTAEPADTDYEPIDERPVLVGESQADTENADRSSQWPPFAMHFVDGGLDEGWYAYCVSGVDLFGRHSRLSDAAAWYQWDPAPDPLPWYFVEPIADAAVHAFAVGLLDKLAPPPPTALAATALDPLDPHLLRDDTYTAWHEALPEGVRGALTGLRVRWRWTEAQARQAPDAKEFRVYSKADRFNKLAGSVVTVSASSSTETLVTTDIDVSPASGAYVGAVLQVGNDSYPIVGSEAGTPLRVRVENLGSDNTVAPAVRAACTVVIPASVDALYVDARFGAAWDERIHVVDIDDHIAVGVQSIWNPSEEPLEGTGATVAGDVATLPGADLGSVRAGVDWLWLDEDAGDGGFLIVDKNEAGATVRVSGAPSLITSSSAWRIGVPYRQYELFLPSPDGASGDGILAEPTLAQPVVRAQIGVSTADDKTHTADDDRWGGSTWGGRPGNEGAVRGPVEIFRVRRAKPDAPGVAPPDSERIYATPADYHARSFYTHRWLPEDGLAAHVYRASDESVFAADWKERPRAGLSADDLELFPDESDEPSWNSAKRAQVAEELNALSDFEDSAEGKAAAFEYYRNLSNDGLRTLAGLPETARAFQRLTIAPLDPDDPSHADRVGPDNPTTYAPDAALRAYVDTLSGRSTNRFFYRTAYVDGAQNQGALSLSSPPVWLPNVVPPRTPTFTKVLAGDPDETAAQDGKITLYWASNREADLVEYRIYRAGSESASRDIRSMALAHTETVTETDPTARPATVSWTDETPAAGTNYYYRLVAVDTEANASRPTRAVSARAFDDSRVAPPEWNAAEVDTDAGSAALSWTASEGALQCLVQGHIDGMSGWKSLSSWLEAGQYAFVHEGRRAGLRYVYRLRVRDESGKSNSEFNELIV